MMSRFVFVTLFISATVATTVAQPTEAAGTAPEAVAEDTAQAPAADGLTITPTEITLDAYDAVHEGNRLLRAGQAKDALRLYEHANQLQPEAREIAFAEGLSQYALGEYEQARESLQRVSLGQADALADDAIYSEGASYHTEALSAMDNPQLALSQLEHAMQRYQTVLANRPEHEAAKDANYKAAHAWRQIKQMMQQQEQQQQQQQQGDEQNDEQEQQDQDQQQQKDENEQQQEQQPNESDQQQDQQQEQQQQGDQQEKDEQLQQDEQQQEQADQDESEQQPQPSQQEQDVSREQAERKLREMMQAQRQRQKNRKKQRALVPVRTTEKDW